MNKSAKVAIVIVLLAAVGFVIALKQNNKAVAIDVNSQNVSNSQQQQKN